MHDEPWIEFHRRRLRAAWHFMSEAEMDPQSPFQPWHVKSLRRHGWMGHVSCMFTDASQAMRWRDFSWWQRQQGLPVTGVRHPARYHHRRFDSDVSNSGAHFLSACVEERVICTSWRGTGFCGAVLLPISCLLSSQIDASACMQIS